MSGDDKRPLGKILLQRKLVSQKDLDAALRAQKAAPDGEPLASHLVEEGKVDEVDALRALSEQYGVPGIDLTQVVIAVEHLDVLTRELAEKHSILPVLIKGDRIFLAMGDPQEKRVVDELEFVTGNKVYPYIAVHSTLVRTIHAAYEAKARGEQHYFGARVPPETLRQLGLAPQPPPPPAKKPPRKPPPLPQKAEPPDPPARAIVHDAAFEETAASAEISTGEFGTIGREISSVSSLPEELRVRASQAADAVATGGGKLILIVDDEEEIRVLLTRLLLQKGHRVIEADRGVLALRLVKEHVPDLIVLDAMLPELHGFDIARRIKGSAKYGAIPIIMVSAVYRGPTMAEDLKSKYGIDAYLEKPFRIADVLEAVQRLLAPVEVAAAAPPEPARDPEALSSDAERALSEGVAAYRSGQIDLAIQHLKRGVGIDPLAYRLHFHLALLYGKKGQVFEGIQELERAIDLNPRHFAALKNLAVLYEKAGFKSKAVAMWERCASGAPDEAARASIREHLRKLM
ncbi:MAG TPA: response regulator [Polyangiaceae bacterium]|nr:response regulator [Polyangiaceae bacterium]